MEKQLLQVGMAWVEVVVSMALHLPVNAVEEVPKFKSNLRAHAPVT